MNSFALDLKVPIFESSPAVSLSKPLSKSKLSNFGVFPSVARPRLVTSSSGGMPSELFQRLLRVSSFSVEAPGHFFGERESGDVFEKPNGRRNRVVIRLADFFLINLVSVHYPLSQKSISSLPAISLGLCVQLFPDGRVFNAPQ